MMTSTLFHLVMLFGLFLPGTEMLGQERDRVNPISLFGTIDHPASLATKSTEGVYEEQGRRILSGAFVRIGPDGHLLVRERDGRQFLLHDVTMQAKSYCGRLVSGSKADERHCGKYRNVVAARSGDAQMHITDPGADGVALDQKAIPKLQ